VLHGIYCRCYQLFWDALFTWMKGRVCFTNRLKQTFSNIILGEWMSRTCYATRSVWNNGQSTYEPLSTCEKQVQ
jgi:hypothetical protein